MFALFAMGFVELYGTWTYGVPVGMVEAKGAVALVILAVSHLPKLPLPEEYG